MAHLNTGNNLKNHEDFDQNNQDNSEYTSNLIFFSCFLLFTQIF